MAQTKIDKYPEAAGNWNFNVQVLSIGGDALDLDLPVDAIRGLNDGSTNVIRHRSSGISKTSLKPYAGLSTAEMVTLEGTCLFDLGDIKKLQHWRDQVKGKADFLSLGGEYRNLTIIPVRRKEVDWSAEVGSGSKIFLTNCLATKLTISDFDINSPEILSWSLEIQFEDMEIN